MWFSESFSDMLGAWLGAGAGVALGTLGAFAGSYAYRGKFKKLVLSSLMILIVLGLICHAVAFFALLSVQPFHVWYPFALVGIILTFVAVPQWFLFRKLYKLFELKKMSLEDM